YLSGRQVLLPHTAGMHRDYQSIGSNGTRIRDYEKHEKEIDLKWVKPAYYQHRAYPIGPQDEILRIAARYIEDVEREIGLGQFPGITNLGMHQGYLVQVFQQLFNPESPRVHRLIEHDPARLHDPTRPHEHASDRGIHIWMGPERLPAEIEAARLVHG